MGPSTHNLAALPNAGKLEKLCQSLAILDAILSPEWGSCYYSFNSHWAEKTALASMRSDQRICSRSRDESIPCSAAIGLAGRS